MSNINEVMAKFKRPFHPSHVTWKPGAITKDQTKALAMAYGDLRAYQNRLDEDAGGEWSVTYSPWGDKIICHITVFGVTRSSVGEADGQSERSEIDGTAAEAQAFKRACAMFGLGRYLYDFPTSWVEYDPNTKKFTDKAMAKLEGIVTAHYRRWSNEHDAQAFNQPQAQPAKAPQPQVEHRNITSDAELDKVLDEVGLVPEAEANPFNDDSIGVAAQNKAAEERMKAKAQEWRQLDHDSDKPCSEAQYNVLVMAVEKLCGKGTHTDAFKVMFKRAIDSEHRPGSKAVSWLLDRVPSQIPARDSSGAILKENGKTVLKANDKFDADAEQAVVTLYQRYMNMQPA